jgi:hypothetical protein
MMTDSNWNTGQYGTKGITNNDVRRWVASWCRDNMGNNLGIVMSDLIHKP